MNTPPSETPPRSITPLSREYIKLRNKQNEKCVTLKESAGSLLKSESIALNPLSRALDPIVLSKAILKECDGPRNYCDVTPGASPSRKRQRVYGDR